MAVELIPYVAALPDSLSKVAKPVTQSVPSVYSLPTNLKSDDMNSALAYLQRLSGGKKDAVIRDLERQIYEIRARLLNSEQS